MSGNFWYEQLTRRAKYGPRWRPERHEARCEICGVRGEDRIRWFGYSWCEQHLPALAVALLHAPERPVRAPGEPDAANGGVRR